MVEWEVERRFEGLELRASSALVYVVRHAQRTGLQPVLISLMTLLRCLLRHLGNKRLVKRYCAS
jgi:hypothetical protein